MKLSLNIFGIEIATVKLELPDSVGQEIRVDPVSSGIKGISRFWAERMTR